MPVVATGDKVASILRQKIRSAVAEAEVPLSGWASHRRVQGMIMPLVLKTGQQDLPFVYLWVESGITIDVGVNDEIRCCRENDSVVEHRQAKRRVTGIWL